MTVLTIEETARILGLNPHTVYRYAREGKIPAIRIGRNWRIVREMLEKWLTEKAADCMKSAPGGKQSPKRRVEEEEDPIFSVLGIVSEGDLTQDLDKRIYEETQH